METFQTDIIEFRKWDIKSPENIFMAILLVLSILYMSYPTVLGIEKGEQIRTLIIMARFTYILILLIILRKNWLKSKVHGILAISDGSITIEKGAKRIELPLEKVKKIDLEYLGLGDRWVSSISKIKNRLKIVTDENEIIEHGIVIKNKKEKERLKRILRTFKEKNIDLRIHNLNPNLAVNF